MNRPRAADDFASIRARMEELRREREQAEAGQTEVQLDPPTRPRRSTYWYSPNVEPGLGRTGIADPARSNSSFAR